MAETIDIPHEVVKTDGESGPDIIVLKFADSKIPVFRESRNKDYIEYGDKNAYPEYLTYLFDKSAKHNAILTGKSRYVFGEGFANGDFIINRLGESLNDISKKAILDVEIYGGFRFEVIWSFSKKIAEIYHVDYSTIRKGKSGGFYYKEAWNYRNTEGRLCANTREEEEFMPAFNPSKPYGSQIYAYNEYRPMTRFYPLPSYIGCNNYVETDIEISKYYLSAIRNGMMPSKMVQFYQGEPSEDKKREIEHRFAKKFAGAENAGRFILVFNSGKEKQVDINDLSASEVDKQFVELNKTCQQEIFSGHLVTSPMLFGIKTEGQLGGNTELRTSYEIFQNTYAKPKACAFDKEINYLMRYSNWPGVYKLMPTDPIGIILPDSVVEKALTPEEVRERLGLPKIEKPVDTSAEKTLSSLTAVSPLVATKILDNLTRDEIRSLAGLPPVPGGNAIPADTGAPIVSEQADGDEYAPDSAIVNESLKNLTAKQLQHINRTIRMYKKGQMAEPMARALLQSGYGLSEEQIDKFLGIAPPPPTLPALPAAMSFEKADDIVAMFDACGDSKQDFEILKSKRVVFNKIEQAADDEAIYIQEAFKSFDVTATENQILELIKKDSKVTPKVIADTIGESETFVTNKIAGLVKKGYLDEATQTVGADEIVERSITEALDVKAPPPAAGATNPTLIFIKYSYEVKPNIGPSIIPTTRPFCRKMVSLNRLYSRAEIESISQRLGYSVFDRKGGWWGESPECRHQWKSNIVVKKGGDK